MRSLTRRRGNLQLVQAIYRAKMGAITYGAVEISMFFGIGLVAIPFMSLSV